MALFGPCLDASSGLSAGFSCSRFLEPWELAPPLLVALPAIVLSAPPPSSGVASNGGSLLLGLGLVWDITPLMFGLCGPPSFSSALREGLAGADSAACIPVFRASTSGALLFFCRRRESWSSLYSGCMEPSAPYAIERSSEGGGGVWQVGASVMGRGGGWLSVEG